MFLCLCTIIIILSALSPVEATTNSNYHSCIACLGSQKKHCRALCDDRAGTLVADLFPRTCRIACQEDEVEVRCDDELASMIAAHACPSTSGTAISGLTGVAATVARRTTTSNSDGDDTVTQMKGAGNVIWTATWFIVVVYVLLPIMIITFCVMSFVFGVFQRCCLFCTGRQGTYVVVP